MNFPRYFCTLVQSRKIFFFQLSVRPTAEFTKLLEPWVLDQKLTFQTGSTSMLSTVGDRLRLEMEDEMK